MNLSRLILNPRNAGARREADNPHGLHRTLMRAFDHAEKSSCGQGGKPPDNRVLFRIEPERKNGKPVVLVQSEDVEPQWQPLLENDYLFRADGPNTLDPQLSNGQALRFRLAANPTKKVNGSRVPLIHATIPADAASDFKTYWNWFERRSEMAGFRAERVQDAPFRTASNREEREDYRKHQIPHFGVRFDGLLRVADPDALLKAIRCGIGPAKSFGFGLLSLALPQ